MYVYIYIHTYTYIYLRYMLVHRELDIGHKGKDCRKLRNKSEIKQANSAETRHNLTGDTVLLTTECEDNNKRGKTCI